MWEEYIRTISEKGQVFNVILVPLLITLNIFHIFSWCFHGSQVKTDWEEEDTQIKQANVRLRQSRD